jgi:hypothetical protein
MWQLPQRLVEEVCKNLLRLKIVLRQNCRRRFTMHPLTRNCFLGFATAGALALTVASTPSFAGDPPEVLGPVGPNDPIVTTVGRKTVLAFYEADGSHCGMHVVMWDRGDESGDSAAGFRVTLDGRQVVHIDTAQNKSIGLQCGSAADTLAIVETGKIYSAGAAE